MIANVFVLGVVTNAGGTHSYAIIGMPQNVPQQTKLACRGGFETRPYIG